MDVTESRMGSPGPHPMFPFVTSLKVWLTVYSTVLILCQLFIPAIMWTVLFTSVLYFVLSKFSIPAADQQTVEAFFGKQFRPSTLKDTPTSLRSRSVSMTASQGESPVLSVLAHRGAGLDAPENSISAFRLAASRGCTAVEFDVSLTKDGIPVIFHDDNLMRIAGIDREIRDMTFEELRAVDISILHPLGERFRGECVPTLEEAITTCLSLGLKFIIDLKDDDEKIVQAIVGSFRRHPEMYTKAVVSSFLFSIIYKIRREDHRIIGCMAWRPMYHRYRTWNSNWENLEPRYTFFGQTWFAIVKDALDEWAMTYMYWWFLGLSAYLFHKDCIPREATYRWQKKGVRIYAWTVNSPVEKLQFIQNVNLGYLTDTLDVGDAASLGACDNGRRSMSRERTAPM